MDDFLFHPFLFLNQHFSYQLHLTLESRDHLIFACAVGWHKLVVSLQRNTLMNAAMIEIILSVSLYLGVLTLMLKGAFTLCDKCNK